MFNSGTKEKKSSVSSSNGAENESGATTVIAKGTQVDGKFVCSENVRLDGKILGEVKVDKRFVMGEESYVEGNIHARNATIKGKVKGDIAILEALHLMESSIIDGNIVAKTIVVDEGARYNGNCKVGDTKEALKSDKA
ncbi:MAG: polymer-forming cytoskeletal protein [Saprospiraceae bacterium]|nr:polymer-forming cytoskeletal protein [Lewinellaceae bacterium]